MDAACWSEFIKQQALAMGFDRCGIARAEVIGRSGFVRAWLDGGRAGTMTYLHRFFAERCDPRRLLEGAKSVVMVALNYHQKPPQGPERARQARGRVAMYAWGEDYHVVVKEKLHRLADAIRGRASGPVRIKACADTAPLLEREWAVAAGVGWIGKNTMVLDAELGSYFVLGGLVTSIEAAPDEPGSDHCGTCTACLDACPTGALTAPYEMDASRCISYLTIEHRDDIPEELGSLMGDWVFGCDICQEVCPHNRKAPATTEPRFSARVGLASPVLDDLIAQTPQDYRRNLRDSSIGRATREMLQRNARLAIANAARS